jgi:hypothetical protein
MSCLLLLLLVQAVLSTYGPISNAVNQVTYTDTPSDWCWSTEACGTITGVRQLLGGWG